MVLAGCPCSPWWFEVKLGFPLNEIPIPWEEPYGVYLFLTMIEGLGGTNTHTIVIPDRVRFGVIRSAFPVR